MKNQGWQVRGAVIEFRDITQRRDMDEKARRLSSAVEQTADSVFITNKSGVIEYVNPAFESTTGYSKAESLGKTPALLKSGQYDASFYRELWATVKGGEVFRATIANRKNGGEIYWAQQTITPMKNADGTITHFVSVLKDVTAEGKQQELEYQMRLASEVQRNLYRDLVAMPAGFDIVGSVHPADAIGGDLFDLIPMPGGCLGIAIGDVVGHSLNSALLMAETRACLRSIATADSNVSRILAALNEVVTPDFGAGFFATVLFAKIDPREKTLSYSNAGHVPGYLFNTRGRIKHVLSSTGTPIGLFKDFECPSGGSVKLDPGSLLVFMTDGITEAEAQNGSMMGSKPVLKFIRRNRHKSAGYLSRGLFRLAKNFAGNPTDRSEMILLRSSAKSAERNIL